MQLINDLWHGDIPLSKTFWLFGVCMSLLFRLILICFIYQPQILSTTIGWVFYLAITVFSIVWEPFIFISIWRSSEKYKGIRIYAQLTRFVVIFWGLKYVIDLIQTAKELLD